MVSLGKDEKNEMSAIENFKSIIKSNVQQCSANWSELWPRLRENADCAKLIKVIGIEKAHKVFCQYLKDIKVDEVGETHPHHKIQNIDQQHTRNLDKTILGYPADSGRRTKSSNSLVKNKSCLSDEQTTSVNTLYDGTSVPNSSPVNPKFSPTPSSPTSILGSPPLSPNESIRSLPCLPTSEKYSSSKRILNTSQLSLDGYATVTSSNAIERQQVHVSPSMEHFEKNDIVFNASEIQSDTNNDDIETSEHLDDTNFETTGYYDIIDDQHISLQEQNTYSSNNLYSSSPPTITPYQTTYIKKVSDESQFEDPYYSIPADEADLELIDANTKRNSEMLAKIEQLTDLLMRKEENEKELLSEIREKDKEIEKLKLSLKGSELEEEERESNDKQVEGQDDDEVKHSSSKSEADLCFCKVYSEKTATLQWQFMFTVVKDLDALQLYINKYRPELKEDQIIDIILKSQSDVEFDVQKYCDETPHGWEIKPRRLPLKVKHASIISFGSGNYSEPPSCLVDVYAEEKPDTTEKRLHYKIPLLGAEQSVDICINLSSRPRYDTAKVESTASCKDHLIVGEKVKRVRRILQNVLKENYPALAKLLKISLESFATEMHCHDLISETTKNAGNFNDMMSEFEAVMDLIDNGQELVEHCVQFLQSLAKQGKLHKRAANCIAEKWTSNIKEKMDLNIKFDIL